MYYTVMHYKFCQLLKYTAIVLSCTVQYALYNVHIKVTQKIIIDERPLDIELYGS